MSNKVSIVIKVSDEMRAALDTAAKQEMRSRSNLVEKILSDYLSGLDIEDARIHSMTVHPVEFEDI